MLHIIIIYSQELPREVDFPLDQSSKHTLRRACQFADGPEAVREPLRRHVLLCFGQIPPPKSFVNYRMLPEKPHELLEKNMCIYIYINT